MTTPIRRRVRQAASAVPAAPVVNTLPPVTGHTLDILLPCPTGILTTYNPDHLEASLYCSPDPRDQQIAALLEQARTTASDEFEEKKEELDQEIENLKEANEWLKEALARLVVEMRKPLKVEMTFEVDPRDPTDDAVSQLVPTVTGPDYITWEEEFGDGLDTHNVDMLISELENPKPKEASNEQQGTGSVAKPANGRNGK